MSYLADDAAMRAHFDGQGFLVTRDEVPVQEREADDSYDRLVSAIRVRSFDALLELAREGLTARDVQNAEHDAGGDGGREFLTAAEVLRRKDRSDYYFSSPLAGYTPQKVSSVTPAPNRIGPLAEASDSVARIGTEHLALKAGWAEFDSVDAGSGGIEGASLIEGSAI